MILGLPWSWDVKATFDIRNTFPTIGDPNAREMPVQIRGPLLLFTGKHRLALAPLLMSTMTSFPASKDPKNDDNGKFRGMRRILQGFLPEPNTHPTGMKMAETQRQNREKNIAGVFRGRIEVFTHSNMCPPGARGQPLRCTLDPSAWLA
ncbi:hypothetical protein GGR50DRAFT_534966 [Xylaria sp. CBS 124048]|nr:hypothetical protein GGR50DRAFT_534966 [Xylaria sp. CBS 124048]